MQPNENSSRLERLHAEEVSEHNEKLRVINGTKNANEVELSTPVFTSSTGRRFRTLDDEFNSDVDHMDENTNSNNADECHTNTDHKISVRNNNNCNTSSSICYDSYGFRVTAREKAAEHMYDILLNGMSFSNSASSANNIDISSKVATSCLSATLKEKKVHEKWVTTLQKWDKVSAAQKKKMCRRGIPRSIRQEAWRKILGMPDVNKSTVINGEHTNSLRANSATANDTVMNNHKFISNNTSSSNNYSNQNNISSTENDRSKETSLLTTMSYRELYSANLSSHELGDIIERDLNRTFPTHRWFDRPNSKGQCMLRRILHAYANRNPDVGYCQGMGFVVSTLLVLFEDEESAFWAFCALMEAPMYNLQTMYFPGFDELKCKFYVMEKLLKRLQPKVYRRIKNADVDPSLYATHWFLTLFSYNLNFALLLRIWDMFLCEGWKPIYRVALSFFFLEGEHITAIKDDSELVKLLMSMHERAYPSELLETAQHIKFKTSNVKTYELNFYKKMRKKRKKKNV